MESQVNEHALKLSMHIAGFAQLLREHEFNAGPEAVMLAHTIAASGYLAQPRLLKAGYRACFCKNHKQWQQFDFLFDNYWYPSEDAWQTSASDARSNASASINQGEQKLIGLGGTSEKQQQTEEIFGAGDYKALSLADFRFVFDPAQKQQIQILVDNLARRVRRQYFRKQRVGNKGRRIELGRSAHRAIRTNGQLMRFVFRAPRKRLPRFVLMLDISQSMDVYAKLFLRFARQLMSVFVRSEAFVFNTQLMPLGQGFEHLSEDDFENKINLEAKGWLGGTKIAGSLQVFNSDFLRHSVDAHTTVVIFSDGCDTASPAELADEVRVIQRRAKKLIWVNPLLGRVEAGTANRYMDLVVPFVDAYCSAHNLQSLHHLCRHMLR